MSIEIPNPQPTERPKIVEPDLKTIMDRRRREWKSEINCISLGTIESFNSEEQTAKISLNYMRRIKGVSPIVSNSAINNQASDILVSYPQLIRCPVVFMFGGNASLTFPIEQGDTCIVLFCDRDIDSWFETGGVFPPNSDRVHDMNDAIALVGIRSMANSLPNYNSTKVKLMMGDGFITIDFSGNIVISGTTVSINP